MFDIFSVHMISLIMVGLAVVAVFVHIPFVSEYAFWFAVAAYVMLAAYRPPPPRKLKRTARLDDPHGVGTWKRPVYARGLDGGLLIPTC